MRAGAVHLRRRETFGVRSGWLRDNYTGADAVTVDFGIRMNSNEVRPIPHGGILAVGDSFTAGSEVGNTESYPAHLERLLGSPVLNVAAGGWGVDQITLRAEQCFSTVATPFSATGRQTG